jgi:hypothetical protein
LGKGERIYNRRSNPAHWQIWVEYWLGKIENELKNLAFHLSPIDFGSDFNSKEYKNEFILRSSTP